MQSHRLWTLSLLVSLTACIAEANECSEAKIRAFSDVFTKTEKRTRAEALYSKTCSSRTSSSGLSVTLPVKGVPFTGNASHEAVRNACATSNRKFFEQYEADVLLVHASENVKLALTQACFGGVSILAKEDSGSITVDIFARSKLDDGVIVQSFVASPPAAVEAVSQLPNPGSELKPAGTTLVFKRKSGEDITFVINTEKGNGRAAVTLPGTQELQVKWIDTPVAIKNERGFTHLMFKCRASIEGGKPEIVGGTIDGRPIGVTGETNGSLQGKLLPHEVRRFTRASSWKQQNFELHSRLGRRAFYYRRLFKVGLQARWKSSWSLTVPRGPKEGGAMQIRCRESPGLCGPLSKLGRHPTTKPHWLLASALTTPNPSTGTSFRCKPDRYSSVRFRQGRATARRSEPLTEPD